MDGRWTTDGAQIKITFENENWLQLKVYSNDYCKFIFICKHFKCKKKYIYIHVNNLRVKNNLN